MSGPRAAAIVVAIAGAGATAAVAQGAAMSSGDMARLVTWASGTALAGAVAAAVALRMLRGRSVAAQVATLNAVMVATVMLGAWLGAREMFLSRHDLSALAVLLLSAGTVGSVGALALGDRVGQAGASLLAATRRLGTGEPPAPGIAADAAADTAALARALDETARSLAESREREQAVETSRRELVAWISHDLRTPLAGIRAIAEVLEDGLAPDAESVSRYHSALRREAEQLSGLIDDLFELSRAHAGVLQLEMQRVSLEDVVSDALAGIAPIAARKGVRVEGRLTGPAELSASVPELLRALRNLLENAVRHTPSDGTVLVEAGIEDSSVVVSVRDDGGGIAAVDFERIFDVGYRADRARSPGGGAGLGLAIAKGIVEAHSGRITVQNEPGGARFTVHLPGEASTP